MIDLGSRDLRCWDWHGSSLARFVRDDRGMESVEVALGIALVAAIAGFGMVMLGDALAAWFETAANEMTKNMAFPSAPIIP